VKLHVFQVHWVGFDFSPTVLGFGDPKLIGFDFHLQMPNGGPKLNILNKKTHVFLLINCLCKLLILF
jgi:hypothetical protein